MKTRKLANFYQKALEYVEENQGEELDWAQNVDENTFKNMKSKQFLAQYCYVVYESGFNSDVVSKNFEQLKKAYKNFDLDKLSRMKSVSPLLRIFNNEKKANGFLKGAKQIHSEGFSNFKKRLNENGMNVP